MTPSETFIYKRFAQRLFKEAETVPPGNKESAHAVASIARELVEIYKDKGYASNFMPDVIAWMEHIHENSKNTTSYGDDIKRAYPEIFGPEPPA